MKGWGGRRGRRGGRRRQGKGLGLTDGGGAAASGCMRALSIANRAGQLGFKGVGRVQRGGGQLWWCVPEHLRNLFFHGTCSKGEVTLPPCQRQHVPEHSKSHCLSWDMPVGQGSGTWAVPTNR